MAYRPSPWQRAALLHASVNPSVTAGTLWPSGIRYSDARDVLDALARRGYLEPFGMGVYRITPAGRALVSY